MSQDKDKFLEKLKDPDMSIMRERIADLVEDPKNRIESLTYDQWAMYSSDIEVTVKLVIPGNDK